MEAVEAFRMIDPPLAHERQGLLDREQDPFDVRVERGVELCLGDRPERGERAAPGVGEEDVQTPLLLLDGGVEPVEVVHFRGVRLDRGDVPADHPSGGVQFRQAAPGDEDVGALLHKPLCRGQADAAGPPGDEGDLSFEFSHCFLLWSLCVP